MSSTPRTTILTLVTILALALQIPTAAFPQSESKSKSTSKTSKDTQSSRSSKSKSSSSNSKSSNSKSSKSSDASDSQDSSRASDSAAEAFASQPINPQAFNDQVLSELVFDLTNAERIRAGLRPFESNRYLAASATAHSRDMASRNYFNHKSKGIFNRTDPRERIESAGYQPRMSAENIAMIPTFNSQRIQSYPGYGNRVVDIDYNSYNRMAAYAVQQWMQSKGHRDNILNRSLTELGVGVAIGIRDNVPYVYLTQNFGG